MMKKFSVEVLGQQYGVICGTRKECDMPMELEGQCYNYQKRITVNMVNDQVLDETEVEREGRIKNTVAHEVFHAFCTESGIYLPDDIEEQLATLFAPKVVFISPTTLRNSLPRFMDSSGRSYTLLPRRF